MLTEMLALKISWLCISCYLIINGIEFLKSDWLSATGIARWDCFKSHVLKPFPTMLAKTISFLVEAPVFSLLIFARLVFSVLLLIIVLHGQAPWFLVVPITIITLLVNFRIYVTYDGAFQLANILLVPLAVVSLFPNTTIIHTICYWFITLELILCYTSAGITKLIAPKWRNGSSLIEIMRLDAYGNPPLGDYLDQHRLFTFFVAWGVILLECLFPLFFLLGGIPFYSMLGVCLFFHLSVAVVMGIHRFIFIFIASYPILILCRNSLS